MTTFNIVALIVLSILLIGAVIFYAVAISRESYPIHAHIIFWLAWIFVGGIGGFVLGWHK